jgi:hypothetical protein
VQKITPVSNCWPRTSDYTVRGHKLRKILIRE